MDVIGLHICFRRPGLWNANDMVVNSYCCGFWGSTPHASIFLPASASFLEVGLFADNRSYCCPVGGLNAGSLALLVSCHDNFSFGDQWGARAFVEWNT